MKIETGFADHERAQVAAMYWAAFGQKLGRVMGPDARAQAFIVDVLDPTHSLSARDDDGTLLGIVGFKTFESALVSGSWGELAKHYGWFGSTWRCLVLALLERDKENERFLMDGIFVGQSAQGKGVGTALLRAIVQEAGARGYSEIRLDVIDANPRARALYEREGYVANGTQYLGPLRHIFGFKSATTMIKPIKP